MLHAAQCMVNKVHYPPTFLPQAEQKGPNNELGKRLFLAVLKGSWGGQQKRVCLQSPCLTPPCFPSKPSSVSLKPPADTPCSCPKGQAGRWSPKKQLCFQINTTKESNCIGVNIKNKSNRVCTHARAAHALL